MRKTAFGDLVIESVEDDLGEVTADHEAGTIYATILFDDTGDYYFEIMENESGDEVAKSEAIFETSSDARIYLGGWLPASDIQSV